LDITNVQWLWKNDGSAALLCLLLLLLLLAFAWFPVLAVLKPVLQQRCVNAVKGL
jgi:hypothetical protein